MAHKITSQDQWFLDMRRHDPLQRSEFKIDDEVVVCQKCRCVQTFDSWEFNNNRCVMCGHNESTDEFTREYIDFSFHEGKKKPRTMRGFKIVGSDIFSRTDKIRDWFSPKRLSFTHNIRLGLNIVMLLLTLGLFAFWGRGYIAYIVVTMVLPLLGEGISKVPRSFMEVLTAFPSHFKNFSKLGGLLFSSDDSAPTLLFLLKKILLLGKNLLNILKKILFSFIQRDWKSRGIRIMTNIRALIDYVTHFFKR